MGMVPEALASYVLSMIREITDGELVIPPGVLHEFKMMSRRLMGFRDVLSDANMKSVTGEGAKAWVTEFKHAMYKATIVVDLCQLKAMTKRGSSAADGCFNPLLSCTRNCSYATNNGSHIKRMNMLFEVLVAECQAFGFGYHPSRHNGGKVHACIPEMLGELNRLGVVGEKIEEAAKALVAEIIQTRKDVNNKISVVAIVGVGGIGKTTLANKVFNDEAIQGEFEKKIWLCIDKDFSEVELLRSAIVAAGGDFQHGKTLPVLQPILQAALTGKKLLLVMDDV